MLQLELFMLWQSVVVEAVDKAQEWAVLVAEAVVA
jgi:hypothetical protein